MIAILNALLESQERQPERFAAALAEALKALPIGNSTPLVSLVNDLPREDLPKTPVKMALPSKDEIAKQWLMQHPEDIHLTGRELEANRTPMDVRISYVTWNKAKKEVKS